MDTQHLNSPSDAPSPSPRGITHINTRHTTRFTVVGNHLAQHRQLSLTAIGLAVHLQSLPSGTRADIKTLAARFPEGEVRIAAALRELEAHGYLERRRERLPSGRIVTHTVSYNQPVPRTAAPPAPEPEPGGGAPEAPPAPGDVPPPPPAPTAPDPAPALEPESASPVPPPAPLPLPGPDAPDPERLRAATALLARLHHHDHRLLLSERVVERLAPAVAAWLERGASPDAVRHALTANLPREPLRHPAALLAHRLTELLPPRPPEAPAASGAPAAPLPLHTCEGCERAFRTPRPGTYCRDCRHAGLGVGAAA
ncbi:helix-turn-helix domain-containing protein [Streptomyces sp. NPDC006134]|uniref:helix-turn-helix domain-containing protein n=1 Tax=Streptomyces sp. NPDC006134 TaxID=3154467 RepID=UPI0033E884CC